MTIDQQLAEALRDVRRENAYRMSHIRVAGTGAFAAVTGVMVLLGDRVPMDTSNSWRISFVGAMAYFVLAVILLFAARTYRPVRRLSRFAVPLFDLPAVVAIQSANILAAGSRGGQISEFSIAILVCLALLSAFTLDLRQIWISLTLTAAGAQFLQHLAGIGLGGRLCSLIVFGVVLWICNFAGRNRVELVTRVAVANAHRQRLQRYFSPGVGGILENHDEDILSRGAECELTVVFTDIRGFTRMTESLSGPEIIGFLNDYHARMVEAIFAHGGTLDKYLGDGLMIYFNAPVDQLDHALRAVNCALAMQRELAAMNTERSWHGQDRLRIGIGIHTGRAVVGDIGAPHRREFTAIGDAVNVAARLEELTKEAGHDVLVSCSTVEQLHDEFAWQAVGPLPIRGRLESIEVFTPGLAAAGAA